MSTWVEGGGGSTAYPQVNMVLIATGRFEDFRVWNCNVKTYQGLELKLAAFETYDHAFASVSKRVFIPNQS